MSTSTRLSASQKGGVALIILIVIIVAGLALGVFLVSQKTNLLHQAYNKTPASQATTTSEEPNVSLKTEYENPFDEATSYKNPFEDYQNPFENL